MSSRRGTRGTAFTVPAGKSAYGVGGWTFSNVPAGAPATGVFTMDTPADLTTATLLKVSSSDASGFDVSLALSRLVTGDIVSFGNELRPEEAVLYELTADSSPGAPADHYELSVQYVNHSGPNPLVNGEVYIAEVFANPQPVAHRTTHEIGGSDEVRPEKLTAANFNDEEGMRAAFGQWVATPLYSKQQVDQNDAATLASANAYTDAHEARQDNPHQVSAAQVDAYTKAEVDSLIQQTLEWVAGRFSFAAHGSMSMSAPTGPDSLGVLWQDLTEYDTIDYPPLGVTLNPANGRFAINEEGIWYINFFVSFTHNESNQGRETGIRVYNETQGIAGDDVTIGIGRNQTASFFSVGFLLQVDANNKDDEFVMQMGGGSSVSIDEWESMAVDINNEGAWVGALPTPQV